MEKWTNFEVIVFALVITLVVVGLSNRQLIPYVNAGRGFQGPRKPINGTW